MENNTVHTLDTFGCYVKVHTLVEHYKAFADVQQCLVLDGTAEHMVRFTYADDVDEVDEHDGWFSNWQMTATDKQCSCGSTGIVEGAVVYSAEGSYWIKETDTVCYSNDCEEVLAWKAKRKLEEMDKANALMA